MGFNVRGFLDFVFFYSIVFRVWGRLVKVIVVRIWMGSACVF